MPDTNIPKINIAKINLLLNNAFPYNSKANAMSQKRGISRSVVPVFLQALQTKTHYSMCFNVLLTV